MDGAWRDKNEEGKEGGRSAGSGKDAVNACFTNEYSAARLLC